MAEETRGDRKGLRHTAPPYTRQATAEMLLSTSLQQENGVTKVRKPWKKCPVVAPEALGAVRLTHSFIPSVFLHARQGNVT